MSDMTIREIAQTLGVSTKIVRESITREGIEPVKVHSRLMLLSQRQYKRLVRGMVRNRKAKIKELLGEVSRWEELL